MKKTLLFLLLVILMLAFSSCAIMWQTAPDRPTASNTPTENTNDTPTTKPVETTNTHSKVENEPVEEEPIETEAPAEPVPIEKHLINPGEEFTVNSYIEFEGTEILYNGTAFEITNNRDDFARMSAMIVGVKADGSYDWLQIPPFSGVDKTRYDEDMEENGWAIEHSTNLVRPGETVVFEMIVMDTSGYGDEYPAPDIDGDGYYDLVFVLSPQESEDHIVTSTSDPESAVYKLKAK